ncbi:MAG: hypothetical protein ABSB82_14700 [Terriglobia bacterium]|jgi:hypothetical protein
MSVFLYSKGFSILVNGLALALLLYSVYKGSWKRLAAPLGYVFGLVLIDGVAREYVLYRYGLASDQYRSFYWLTDVALALGAFLVVGAFFYRACAHDVKMWRFVRLVLSFVFFLVLGISLSSLTRNSDNLRNAFFFEFQQNLYFTCLVLNTLLYIMMQQFGIADDELNLLVCGMGLQFAGPAANFALASLTSYETARALYSWFGPLCTLGMLLTWSYAVVKMPKPAEARTIGRLVPVLVRSRRVA